MSTSNHPTFSDSQHKATEVRIYNQGYSIRGGNTAYIKKLATYLDHKMREVSQATHTVDTLRVAILASLNVIDELFQAQSKIDQLDTKIAERSSEYSEILDSVLKNHTKRKNTDIA